MRRGTNGGILKVTNILVVGSSHVGAIKQGFDSIETPSSLKLQYVAVPGKGFKELTVSNKRLMFPEKDAENIRKWFGLNSCPCLDDFDMILFVAERCRLSLDLYSSDRRIPTLSASVVREIVNNIDNCLFNSLLDAVGPSKLIYLGSPLVSTASHKKRHLNKVPLLDQNNVSDYCLADCIREVCHRTIKDDAMPSILLPPQHLLAKHQFNTLDSYIRGGLRVHGGARADGHDADVNKDMGHGNAEYGKEIATHILDCFVT